jgi:hypothetical protein
MASLRPLRTGFGTSLIFGVLVAAHAAAHDMALDVRWAAEGVLEGQLIYSDSNPADGNYIRIDVPDDPSLSSLALQTDAQGSFRLPLQPGRAYAISADGEEGHRITVAIGAPEHQPVVPAASGPPIYLVLAALLLLSLPLAWRLRRTEATSADGGG